MRYELGARVRLVVALLGSSATSDFRPLTAPKPTSTKYYSPIFIHELQAASFGNRAWNSSKENAFLAIAGSCWRLPY